MAKRRLVRVPVGTVSQTSLHVVKAGCRVRWSRFPHREDFFKKSIQEVVMFYVERSEKRVLKKLFLLLNCIVSI